MASAVLCLPRRLMAHRALTTSVLLPAIALLSRPRLFTARAAVDVDAAVDVVATDATGDLFLPGRSWMRGDG